jgi:hypothetical protein
MSLTLELLRTTLVGFTYACQLFWEASHYVHNTYHIDIIVEQQRRIQTLINRDLARQLQQDGTYRSVALLSPRVASSAFLVPALL